MNQLAADMSGLSPGFPNPVFDSQSTFRAVLRALARPGMPERVAAHIDPPPPLCVAATALGLTLFDYETPVWIDGAAAAFGYFKFHCGCPMAATPAASRFAIVADPAKLPKLSAFDLGTDEYPDRSTTVVVQVPAIATGGGVTLTGPGIETARRLDIAGLPAPFWKQRRDLQSRFPRGVDLVFAAGRDLCAVPRSTVVEI